MGFRDFQNLPTIKSMRFEGLHFHYNPETPILTNVDFDFPMDSITWIRAESGKGRSALLQLLAGLLTPTSGAYLINQKNVVDMSFEEFNPYRMALGYAFDLGGLISNRTLFENLMLPLMYHKVLPHEDAQKKVFEDLEFFKIKGHKDQRPSMVSGQIRKLVCLARAMILNPQVLLLDDPTIGLSPAALQQLVEKIQTLRELGYLNHIFVCTNDEKFISKFDVKIVQLDNFSLQNLVDMKKVVAL